MNLYDKYSLGQVVSEGEVKTYAARDLNSGSSVFVHCLGTARVDLMTMVVRHLRAAPQGVSSGVLDMFESEDEVFLITEVLPGFSDLRTWLGAEAPGSAAPSASLSSLQKEGPRPDRSVEKPGEGKPAAPQASLNPRRGQPTKASVPKMADADASAANSSLASPSTEFQPNAAGSGADQSGSEPGEFTRFFAPSSVVDSSSAPSAPPRPVGPGFGSSSRTGDAEARERSRPDVGELRPPSGSHPARDQEPAARPGDFTQLFQPSRGDEFVGPDLSAPHFPVNNASEASQKPGEFTQLFQPSSGDRPIPFEDAPPQEIEEPGRLREPGFNTLFGPAIPETAQAHDRDLSGTAIFPPAGSLPATTPESVEAGKPAASSEMGVKPIPVSAPMPPSVPKPPVAPMPMASAFPEPVVKAPPTLQPPSVPKVPVPAKPPLAKPAMPQPTVLPAIPRLKPPVMPKLPDLSKRSAGEKRGPSTLELILILAGLVLVVVAAVLFLRFA